MLLTMRAETCENCRYIIINNGNYFCDRHQDDVYNPIADTCDDFFDRAIIHPDELSIPEQY